MKLSGKIALVTGGARGLGRAAALAMAREGASIVVADLLADIAKESAEEIRETGVEALAIVADISNSDAIDEAFARTQSILAGSTSSSITRVSRLTGWSWNSL